MPTPSEGVNVVPGVPGTSGELTTVSLRPQGGVVFDGHIEGLSSIPPEDHDPTHTNVWLRSWQYLVPFPAPTWRSTFTYRFDVSVHLRVFNESDPGEFWSYVSVGEEPDFNPGDTVEVDQDAGWPLQADLTVPASPPAGVYNGRYGFLDGHVSVERTFTVHENQTPAVAITVGAIGFLGQLGYCDYQFGGVNSSITPHDEEDVEGRISFHYFPLPIVSG